MVSTEKLCLQWNDFETNISQAFRELREEKDFFDVSIVCDDCQIQAHKVILSACSPFFRTILRRNPHPHPLIYIKGVEYKELQNVLNFMYMGEVSLAQNELSSFLAVASDLKVKGLSQKNEAETTDLNTTKNIEKVINDDITEEDAKKSEEFDNDVNDKEDKMLPIPVLAKKKREPKQKRKPSAKKQALNILKASPKDHGTKSIDEGSNTEENITLNTQSNDETTQENVNNSDESENYVNDTYDNILPSTIIVDKPKDTKQKRTPKPSAKVRELNAPKVHTTKIITSSNKQPETVPIQQTLNAEPSKPIFQIKPTSVPTHIKEAQTESHYIVDFQDHGQDLSTYSPSSSNQDLETKTTTFKLGTKRKYQDGASRETATLENKKEEKNYYFNPTITKGATSSPKWQCNMCAQIFPTKDDTIIHLKDSHQIAKSSVYGKRIKQIA